MRSAAPRPIPKLRLRLMPTALPMPKRLRGSRYTPVAKRNDRPDAIAFLLRNYPQLSEAQVSKLLGTTKDTIQKVRERTHWNSANIKPRDPVILGLCSQTDLNAAIAQANERLEREGRAVPPPPVRRRTRSPDASLRLGAEPLHLLLDLQLLDLQAREGLAVGPRSLVLVGDAQFERGMAFLQGIETGLQGHGPPPLKVSRDWHGNPIDMVGAMTNLPLRDSVAGRLCYGNEVTMLTDRDSLLRKLHELRSEHRDLDTVIARLAEQGAADQLHLQRLKKRKLMLKDEIAWLESRLIPDSIA